MGTSMAKGVRLFFVCCFFFLFIFILAQKMNFGTEYQPPGVGPGRCPGANGRGWISSLGMGEPAFAS